MGWILQGALALYAVGLLLSLVGFYRKRQLFITIALALVGCGFIAHTVFLTLLGFQRRHFPITSLPDSLCFLAWSLTLTFIAAYFRYKINALGAFVLPLVSALMVL